MVRCPKCGSKRVSKFESKWKCDMCRCVFTSSNSIFDDFDVNDAFAQVERLRSERREKERLEQEKLEKARKEKEREERAVRRKREKTAQERVKALNEKRIKEKAKLRRNYTKSAHRKVITAIKEGKTRAEAAELANVSINDINWWYSHGKQGEKPYASYYNDYINARKIAQGKENNKGNKNSTKGYSKKANLSNKGYDKGVKAWLKDEQLEIDRLESARLSYAKSKSNKSLYENKESKSPNLEKGTKIELQKKKSNRLGSEKTTGTLKPKSLDNEIQSERERKVELQKKRLNNARKEQSIVDFKELEKLKKEREELANQHQDIQDEIQEKERKEREASIAKKRRSRVAKEEKAQYKKGVYVHRSLNLLRKIDYNVLNIVFENYNLKDHPYYSKESKIRYIAQNYPFDDILQVVEKAENQFKLENQKNIEKQETKRLSSQIDREKEKERIEGIKYRRKFRVREGETYGQYINRINKDSDLESDKGMKKERKVKTQEEKNQDIWAIVILFGILLLIYLIYKIFGS